VSVCTYGTWTTRWTRKIREVMCDEYHKSYKFLGWTLAHSTVRRVWAKGIECKKEGDLDMYLWYNIECGGGVRGIGSLVLWLITAFQLTIDGICGTDISKLSCQYCRSHIKTSLAQLYQRAKWYPTQATLNHAWVHVDLHYHNGVL
jgi:hypothetical protein